jgi:hypothetical protein
MIGNICWRSRWPFLAGVKKGKSSLSKILPDGKMPRVLPPLILRLDSDQFCSAAIKKDRIAGMGNGDVGICIGISTRIYRIFIYVRMAGLCNPSRPTFLLSGIGGLLELVS